jgi:hypothetical protein
LLDVVVTAVARGADTARFEDLRVRAREEADPAAKRRYLHALARVENPALASRAVALSLTEDVPMQDFTSFLSVLLSNRATREETWQLIKTRFPEVRAKADSPMLLRRLVEALDRAHVADRRPRRLPQVVDTEQALATQEPLAAGVWILEPDSCGQRATLAEVGVGDVDVARVGDYLE